MHEALIWIIFRNVDYSPLRFFEKSVVLGHQGECLDELERAESRNVQKVVSRICCSRDFSPFLQSFLDKFYAFLWRAIN